MYVHSRGGFCVAVPSRFQVLEGTVDPLARTIRELEALTEEEAVVPGFRMLGAPLGSINFPASSSPAPNAST